MGLLSGVAAEGGVVGGLVEFLAKGTLGITCWSASQSLRQDQLSISEPSARLGRGFRQAGVAGEAR